MSNKEIMTFEQLWQKIWEIIYAIINFFKGAEGGNGGHGQIPGATETFNYDNIGY